MGKKNTPESIPSTIVDVSFTDALGERYLAYALSTIMARSLPDVRDGLKPVHRRLLYAMLLLKLDPKSGFKKCARVVGDVIGKYHPHGDVAVYDTMVRLAQDFAVRYPLVEGQGNFGSIDGDNAAAMRYTEARLTDAAIALLQDITSDTVDFRPTYDGSELEPVVLPAAFPNLLANGSEGIAVGMATSVPPHNVGEICDALLHLLKHPNASHETLVKHIPAPDFPTGGVLVEPVDSIIKTYESGKGSFRLRARWEKEELGRGGYQIVVTEIPYQVQKSRLIERIADLLKEKKLSLLDNIRDESAEDIRLILEPKSRSVDPEVLMESLFRLTDLETRAQLNMNVLVGGTSPRVLSLREVLQAFLDHRMEVLMRRSRHRLSQIAQRLEVLEGFLIVYVHLDEVIRIIREEDDPKAKIMKRWKLTDTQAEAILNMRLRSLRRLEELAMRQEHESLSAEQAELNALLASEEKRLGILGDEIKDIRKRFGSTTKEGKRRTTLSEAPAAQDISVEAFIEKEPVTILCSKMGWIRSLKGHYTDTSGFKYKEGDDERFVLKAQTTDKLLIFSADGKFFTLGCDKLSGGKGFGEPLNLMVDLPSGEDIIEILLYQETESLFLASSIGKGFRVDAADVLAQTRNGKQVMNVPSGARAMLCQPVSGDSVAVIGENRKLLIFPLEEVPVMKRGQGVTLQRYKQGSLSDVKLFTLAEGLSWGLGNRQRNETNLAPWIGKRGGTGRLPPTGFPRTNRFS